MVAPSVAFFDLSPPSLPHTHSLPVSSETQISLPYIYPTPLFNLRASWEQEDIFYFSISSTQIYSSYSMICHWMSEQMHKRRLKEGKTVLPQRDTKKKSLWGNDNELWLNTASLFGSFEEGMVGSLNKIKTKLPDIIQGIWHALARVEIVHFDFLSAIKWEDEARSRCPRASPSVRFWGSGTAMNSAGTVLRACTPAPFWSQVKLCSFQTHRCHTPTYQDCGVPQLSLAPLSWSEIVI